MQPTLRGTFLSRGQSYFDNEKIKAETQSLKTWKQHFITT